MCNHAGHSTACALAQNSLFFLLAIFGISSALAVDPDSFDVSGMRIGQGIEEIRAEMKAFDKKVEISQAMWRAQPGVEESVAMLDGHVGPVRYGARFGYRLKAAFGQVTKTAYLIVQQAGIEIPNDEKTTYEVLKARMIEKFGPPTQEHTKGSSFFAWVFRDSGQPDPNAGSDNCWSSHLLSDLDDINIRPTDGCGVLVVVKYASAHNNPDLIDTYQVAIFDHREVIRNIKESTRLKDEAEKARIGRELENVAPNKPRI